MVTVSWPQPANQPYEITVESHSSATDATAQGAAPENEFGRFEDLARKLAAVPKTELDEKRKKS